MFDDEAQVAWQAMPRNAPVVASDGTHVGTAERLLGDLDEEIEALTERLAKTRDLKIAMAQELLSGRTRLA